jgi:putative sigma-54 modulation protein
MNRDIIWSQNKYMTIEIYSPHLKVKETILETIEKKIVALSHLGEHISRAEIFLAEEQSVVKENKICTVRLDLIGDTLLVRKNAESFEKAAADAIKVLKKSLKEKAEHRNEPPDVIISTVQV